MLCKDTYANIISFINPLLNPPFIDTLSSSLLTTVEATRLGVFVYGMGSVSWLVYACDLPVICRPSSYLIAKAAHAYCTLHGFDDRSSTLAQSILWKNIPAQVRFTCIAPRESYAFTMVEEGSSDIRDRWAKHYPHLTARASLCPDMSYLTESIDHLDRYSLRACDEDCADDVYISRGIDIVAINPKKYERRIHITSLTPDMFEPVIATLEQEEIERRIRERRHGIYSKHSSSRRMTISPLGFVDEKKMWKGLPTLSHANTLFIDMVFHLSRHESLRTILKKWLKIARMLRDAGVEAYSMRHLAVISYIQRDGAVLHDYGLYKDDAKKQRMCDEIEEFIDEVNVDHAGEPYIDHNDVRWTINRVDDVMRLSCLHALYCRDLGDEEESESEEESEDESEDESENENKETVKMDMTISAKNVF